MRSDRTYRLVNRVGALLLRAWGVRVTARGLEHLPRDGAAVLAANHVGFLDFVVVGWAARQRGRLVRFMTKAAAFDAPVGGWLLRRMGHVPVDRWHGASAYRRARRLLEAGEVVGVFPEATISRSFRVKRLKPGAAGLALSRDVPLVPVAAWGGQRLWTVDGRRTFRRGIRVSILVGEPLVPAEGETIASLTARLRTALEELLEEVVAAYPQAPRDDADRWWVHADRGGSAPDVETGIRLDAEAMRRIGAPED